MPDAQPAPVGGLLPRGHLLTLNRASAALWKPRTRAPEPSRPTPTPSASWPPTARLTAIRSSPANCAASTSQEFIADQLARWKPTTAHNRYCGLHAFFKWAVAEGDLAASPMGGMRPPQLPEQPVVVVRAEHLTRLLKTCEGRDFTSRRDPASSFCWWTPGCAGPSASA